MEAKNVFLVLKGRMQTYVVTDETRTKMKFSLPATVLTSGIPILRKAKENISNLSFQAECLARLYERESWEPIVEILQNQMDYSFLGTKAASSTLLNFDIVVTKLREVFPQAFFNDKLMKSYGVDASPAGVQDELEINCKLIYLYHQTMCDLDSSV